MGWEVCRVQAQSYYEDISLSTIMGSHCLTWWCWTFSGMGTVQWQSQRPPPTVAWAIQARKDCCPQPSPHACLWLHRRRGGWREEVNQTETLFNSTASVYYRIIICCAHEKCACYVSWEYSCYKYLPELSHSSLAFNCATASRSRSSTNCSLPTPVDSCEKKSCSIHNACGNKSSLHAPVVYIVNLSWGIGMLCEEPFSIEGGHCVGQCWYRTWEQDVVCVHVQCTRCAEHEQHVGNLYWSS